ALTDGGNSTHSTITAVKDLPSRSKTFDAVDLYLPNVIGLPVGTSRQTSLRLWTSTPHVSSNCSKKGSVGQKLQSINWPDTTRDEALSSVTVGVLTVLSEDSPQEGPSSIHLEPISTDIVLEGGIVMEKIKNFPQA
ncbi:hypothetical protein KUCAC02_032517, partial [Chaenocephalus aceratus]